MPLRPHVAHLGDTLQANIGHLQIGNLQLRRVHNWGLMCSNPDGILLWGRRVRTGVFHQIVQDRVHQMGNGLVPEVLLYLLLHCSTRVTRNSYCIFMEYR